MGEGGALPLLLTRRGVGGTVAPTVVVGEKSSAHMSCSDASSPTLGRSASMKVALTPPEGPARQVDILEVSPRGRAPRCRPLLPGAGEGVLWQDLHRRQPEGSASSAGSVHGRLKGPHSLSERTGKQPELRETRRAWAFRRGCRPRSGRCPCRSSGSRSVVLVFFPCCKLALSQQWNTGFP